MVHNGIEYGVMAAYAEGVRLLEAGGRGREHHAADAETSPLEEPQYYQFDLDFPGDSRGLAARQRHQLMAARPDGAGAQGRTEADAIRRANSDSGEGRWTLKAAIDGGAPAPVLACGSVRPVQLARQVRFADKLLSAMRYAVGGHLEKKKAGS